jgi:AcrR family transcriptional regulator
MEISKNRVNPEATSEPGDQAASGRRYGGMGPEERQRQRREKLIEAALAVFGEQGFHASTVRDVCGRAELTSRYFYESFESMEVLFEAVYVSVSRELMRKTMVALQGVPMVPEQLAESAMRTFLAFIQEDPRRARVTLIDAQTVGPGVSRTSQQADRDFVALLTSFIDALYPGIDQSTGLSPHLISTGMLGAMMRMAAVWVENKCDLPLDDVLRNMMMFYVAGIQYAEALLAAHGGSPAISRTQPPTLPQRSRAAASPADKPEGT